MKTTETKRRDSVLHVWPSSRDWFIALPVHSTLNFTYQPIARESFLSRQKLIHSFVMLRLYRAAKTLPRSRKRQPIRRKKKKTVTRLRRLCEKWRTLTSRPWALIALSLSTKIREIEPEDIQSSRKPVPNSRSKDRQSNYATEFPSF